VLQRDIDAAWAVIGVVMVHDREQAKSWQDWQCYALAASADPYLCELGRPSKQNLLITFAARVCTGLYRKGQQVGH
jgi:hypothetical protein